MIEAVNNNGKRVIDSILSNISEADIEEVERVYEHELKITNAVFNLTFYSKSCRQKVKPPLRGCFSINLNNHH
jgi:hypothetical protein